MPTLQAIQGLDLKGSQWICESATIGGSVVPIVFWGTNECQGRNEYFWTYSSYALILMGDWCRPTV